MSGHTLEPLGITIKPGEFVEVTHAELQAIHKKTLNDHERLIDAAPDLLEAVKGLLEAVTDAINAGDWKVDGACDPDIDIQRANAAIAKATGEK